MRKNNSLWNIYIIILKNQTSTITKSALGTVTNMGRQSITMSIT